MKSLIPQKKCWSESTCAFSFSLLTWSTLHTIALTLHMSPLFHNLFTITLRCPKVFVSLLTTSVSASHCAGGKRDHCAHFSKGWFSRDWERQNLWRIRQKQVTVTYGNCCKLSCCYTHFPFFPKLARPRTHLLVRQDCATKFHIQSFTSTCKEKEEHLVIPEAVFDETWAEGWCCLSERYHSMALIHESVPPPRKDPQKF